MVSIYSTLYTFTNSSKIDLRVSHELGGVVCPLLAVLELVVESPGVDNAAEEEEGGNSLIPNG